MEIIDNEKAARVWNRVQGEPDTQQKAQGLLTLIAEEWTDAATYLLLARQFQGKESAMLRSLAQQEQAHTACLKGIYTLITGTQPVTRATTPTLLSVQATLRRCYGREMQCLAAYEARSADPEYGRVFQGLAEQERNHCHVILEILGNLKR